MAITKIVVGVVVYNINSNTNDLDPEYVQCEKVFVSFVEKYHYCRMTDVVSKRIHGKKYFVTIVHTGNLRFDILAKEDIISFFDSRERNIENEHMYTIDPNDLCKIIKQRESSNVVVLERGHYKLAPNKYIRNRDACIVSTNVLNPIVFKYSGGILQTNMITNVVKHFDTKNTMVLVPSGMKHLWSVASTITYDDIAEEVVSGNYEYNVPTKITRLVLQESHAFVVNYAKHLLEASTKIKSIWVICSIPFHCYFDPNELHGEYFSMMNMWMRLSSDEKEKCKGHILSSLKRTAPDYYNVCNYDPIPIERVTIELSNQEKYIKDSIMSHFYRERRLSEFTDDVIDMKNGIMNTALGMLISLVDIDPLEYPNECPVCYSSIDVLTACRHSFCLDCFIKWYSRSHKCPMCRDEASLKTIAVKMSEKSALVDFFTGLDEKDVVITHFTNMEFLERRQNFSAKMIVIEDVHSVAKFTKLKKVARIYIVRDPQNNIRDIYDNIIGYCHAFSRVPMIYDVLI